MRWRIANINSKKIIGGGIKLSDLFQPNFGTSKGSALSVKSKLINNYIPFLDFLRQ